jgi:hypothetical protein
MILRARVWKVLLDPSEGWRACAVESTSVARLYRHDILPLAAVPTAALYGGFVLRSAAAGRSDAVIAALPAAMLSYASALALPLLTAAILARLAPRFGASGTLVDALKLTAYASIPYWVSGVWYLVPFLAPLVVVGVAYGVYLFFVGLAPVLKAPYEQRVPLIVVSGLVFLAVSIALEFVSSALLSSSSALLSAAF